ncbi:lysylphosphatidylglycerol synthase transmembrane domain-containing protein [Leifsonia sp. AG29]|uniref:lysylphosphatidylglycerol synthase transmembrane domain-containing protein n=1 Tax=Leifsonia sp. AG29 TaxID=2598860 RepID=UPI001E361EF5|nr:lysylphosphatidylglycerol synthase transmembrane domain-containing protein [Leifsonia sp. AG29]
MDGARSRWIRPALRAGIGAVVLVAVVARVGAGPFQAALAAIQPVPVTAVIGLMAVATAASAWRWRLIARRLGVDVGLCAAIGMYYRSQFLNMVLPGGVVGDVHRAVDHGRTTGHTGTAIRAAALDRVVAQGVQLALTVGVLLWAAVAAPPAAIGGDGPPSAGPGPVALLAIAVGVTAVAMAVAVAALTGRRIRRTLRRESAELRAALGSAGTLIRVVVASLIACCCHLATLWVAIAAVGAAVPPAQLPTLGVVVLLGAAIPVNVGGWGPREGVAGWAFAVAGLGVSTGVAAATLFGVLALIAVAPGAAVAAAALVRKEEHRDPATLRGGQLRHLPRRLPRHGPAAEARALEFRRPGPGR